MSATAVGGPTPYQGNDKLLFGIIMGVIAFWLFAQTTLNVAPDMQKDLGLDASMMNIAVAITALFSGIFIVVIGGLADRVGRLKVVKIGFFLNMLGSLLIGLAPTGDLATAFLLTGRALQGLSAACIVPAQPGAGEDLLGWSGASAGGEPVVHRLLGRFRRLLAVRWLHGAELRMALHLLLLDRRLRDRPADDQGHPGQQG